jgi:hypothetical protein
MAALRSRGDGNAPRTPVPCVASVPGPRGDVKGSEERARVFVYKATQTIRAKFQIINQTRE